MTTGSPVLPNGPLTGVRVVDFTSFQAGALCALLLADMGADVVKIEPPGGGDPARTQLRPMVGDDSAYFLSFNRNKRSVAADLKDERGLGVAKRLIAGADVLVENMRPGSMDRLGLDYETVRGINPRIVYASVTGYGRSGPASQQQALDLSVQAYSGIMSITGPPGGEPTQVGSNITGTAAATYCYAAIVSALLARERIGEGQRVDVAMLDAVMQFLRSRESGYFATGDVPRPAGNINRHFAPMEVFPTADGHLELSVQHDNEWQRLCDILEAPHLRDDPRYATNQDRVANRADLAAALTERFRTRPTAEWVGLIRNQRIMCGAIHDLEDVFADEQVHHNEMVVEVSHPKVGTLKMLGIPMKLSATPGTVRTAPPGRGEHTREVLAEAGFERREIDELLQAGVIDEPATDPV